MRRATRFDIDRVALNEALKIFADRRARILNGESMSHEELRGHYELFAIDAADEPQRSEIQEHLNRGCETCRAELERARLLAARIRGPRRFGWAPFLGLSTALALFAAIYFSGREHQM